MNKEFYDTRGAAEYLNLSPNTLDRWRWSGDGPKYLKLGRSVRYRAKDLEEFVQSSVRHNTSEGKPSEKNYKETIKKPAKTKKGKNQKR